MDCVTLKYVHTICNTYVSVKKEGEKVLINKSHVSSLYSKVKKYFKFIDL